MNPAGTIRIVVFLLCPFFVVSSSWGQGQKTIVITAQNHPLASLQEAATLARAQPPDPGGLFNDIPNFNLGIDTRAQEGGNLDRDPLLRTFNASVTTNLLTDFSGSDNDDNSTDVSVPDPNGDVSSDAVDRYVQLINWVMTVYDKSGTELGGGPFPTSALWTGFGGTCETTNRGDPIVLYDEANDRWLVSQFAWTLTNTLAPPFLQCIAISQTSDPLGAYNRYAFDLTLFGFNDYPKLGITSASITLTARIFTPPALLFGGTLIAAIDKAALYAGDTATLVGANLGTSEDGFVPGDLDDPDGTAGSVPALFVTAMAESSFDSLDVWKIVPDFTDPGNTTITRVSRIPIAPFDPDLCPASRERCIPHPGSGNDLEALSDRLMHRLQIRDFGTHLSMVVAHTVDVGSGRAGIRWYELRSTDGGMTWTLHQEGTHAPDDGLYRWMPSIAMNANGDIGLGYMVSDATTPVEIRIAGQSTGNSGSGTLDADEEVCQQGVAGADWGGRSGDYSSTTVDPDADTFWHTNQYGRTVSDDGWGTHVCQFGIDLLVPVELVSFEPIVDGHSVTLNWATASETNNAGFEIQFRHATSDTRHADWQVLGWVDGHGTTEIPRSYRYRVDDLKPGRHVFRLKQIDFDGTFEYSPEVEAMIEMPAGFVIDPVYPNPFNPEAALHFGVRRAQQVEVALYNMLGQRVRLLYRGRPAAGAMQTIRIDARAVGMRSGTYVVRVVGETFTDAQLITVIQ